MIRSRKKIINILGAMAAFLGFAGDTGRSNTALRILHNHTNTSAARLKPRRDFTDAQHGAHGLKKFVIKVGIDGQEGSKEHTLFAINQKNSYRKLKKIYPADRYLKFYSITIN